MPRKKKPTHGGARDGAGRPPATGETRSKIVFVRVSETEHAAVAARAKRQGVGVAALVRASLGLKP